MASKPWLDPKRLVWYMKVRLDPLGPWKRVKLCKHTSKVLGPKPKLPYEGELKYQEYRDLEHRARVGISVAPPKPRDLDDYLKGYIRSREIGGAASTARHTTHAAERFVEFAKGRGVTTMQGVSRSLCRDYLERRAATLNPNSLKTERGYLMGAWTRAVEDELIAANPWKGAKPPGKILATSITFWTPEEIERIAKACRKRWQSDLVRFLASTGLRVSTALSARWSWIDRDGRFLQIEGGPRIKTVYGHYLGANARALLDRMRRDKGDSPLLFPTETNNGGVPMAYESAREPIKVAIRRSKVPRGTLHDFRHSYGRHLALKGIPVTIIQRQLGHTTLAQTMKYVAATDLDVATFIDRLDA